MSVIEATEITKVYKRGREEVHAIRGVSLSIDSSEFVAIVGPSGAGKTALMNIIGCLDTPTNGTLTIDGIRVTGRTERELVRMRRGTIGFVFQQFFLIPTLTARENIGLPLIFNRRKADDWKIDDILDQVGLSDRASHYPHELSGGEMQRVAIGRALVTRPKILLADEPTGNLDTGNSDLIFHLLQGLNREGLTILMVTHNPGLARRAGRVVSLKDGLIEHDMPPPGCPI
ncbi:MAG: ABC transporter ATP-binding protein [Methanomicrobiales archaeon]|jgi:putative ABC transport system ATP-binding protein|nr:ABC transporter ATP-binding protein [Methanomicrobiales archaeon]